MEARVFGLECFQRQRRLFQRCRWMIENVGAIDAPEILDIAGVLQFGDHSGRIRVGHFIDVEQRNQCLLMQRIDRAIAREATGRAFVLGLVRTWHIVVAREFRGEAQIAQRRHGTRALPLHVGAAKLHRQAVRRSVSMIRTVAGGARHFARSRQ